MKPSPASGFLTTPTHGTRSFSLNGCCLFQLVKRERRAVGELIGYCDRISASAGDTLDVMVHTDQAEYEASVVRLIHGDRNPAGPGFREEEVADVPAVRRPGREQVTHTGSYALIADCPALGGLGRVTAAAWIFPTQLPCDHAQGLISKRDLPGGQGFSCALDESGHLVFSGQLASG